MVLSHNDVGEGVLRDESKLGVRVFISVLLSFEFADHTTGLCNFVSLLKNLQGLIHPKLYAKKSQSGIVIRTNNQTDQSLLSAEK